MTDILDKAIETLRFGADKKDGWSTPLSPEECAALLERIEASVVVTVDEEGEKSE